MTISNHSFEVRSVLRIFLILTILLLTGTDSFAQSFRERLQPIPPKSGFMMDGYWVWGGSVIKVDSVYHLFASRWPKKNKFPDDYFRESEIVRATSQSPMGPYTFQEVVIGERDSSFWDANMAHNPTIHRIGNQYVLFYIGSDFSTFRNGTNRLLRRVGYAASNRIEGPWIRCDKPIISEESNNPAVFLEPDQQIKLIYRDENLKVKIAVAPEFKGPYSLANSNVWPQAMLEDFYLFKTNGFYHLICEDNVGKVTGHIRWGAHLISENGIDNWKVFETPIVYDHTILKTTGDTLHCVRRERPQLLIQQNKITHILTGVYDGTRSWCQPVELVPPLILKN